MLERLWPVMDSYTGRVLSIASGNRFDKSTLKERLQT